MTPGISSMLPAHAIENPYGFPKKYFPEWKFNLIPTQISQIKKTYNLISKFYKIELSQTINPETSKTWLKYMSGVKKGEEAFYGPDFLCAFLFALAVDPCLCFEEKQHAFTLTLEDLNYNERTDFHLKLMTLPLVMSTHIALYSQYDLLDLVLNQIDSPEIALDYIQTVFENVWGAQDQTRFLRKLNDHLYFMPNAQEVLSHIQSKGSEALLTWIKIASPSLNSNLELAQKLSSQPKDQIFPCRIPLNHLHNRA